MRPPVTPAVRDMPASPNIANQPIEEKILRPLSQLVQLLLESRSRKTIS